MMVLSRFFNKVHGLNKDELCRAKSQRGMGFRDFSSFIMALWAKGQPNAYWAKMLKGHILPKHRFPSCPRREGVSHTSGRGANELSFKVFKIRSFTKRPNTRAQVWLACKRAEPLKSIAQLIYSTSLYKLAELFRAKQSLRGLSSACLLQEQKTQTRATESRATQQLNLFAALGLGRPEIFFQIENS